MNTATPMNTAAPMNTTPRMNDRPARRRRTLMVTGGLATAAVLGLGAIFGVGQSAVIAGTAVAAPQVVTADGSSGQAAQPGYGGSNRPWTGTGGQSPTGGGQGETGYPGQGGTTSTVGDATAAQQIGVVDIDAVLGYAGAEAAGTGLVLTSSGEILTNNHVIEGSTSIWVTVVTTGASYTATVVGTDATDDVAVLQLSGASGLDIANIAQSAASVGDAVTGVGNAGGAGGTPAASAGIVTATNQTITTQADGTAAAETLSGLIETNADIQAGDSGGPLFNSGDQVVGVDTAAEAGGVGTAGYAIPIATALGIADRIDSGQASANIVLGYPAFLGVQVSQSQGTGYRSTPTVQGALISGVVDGAPAAGAGLAAGDIITGIDATAISSASDLTSVLAQYASGQTVTITWVGATGAAHMAQVTLASGPAA